MDVELAMDRAARDLDLGRVSLGGFRGRPAPGGAARRPGPRGSFVDVGRGVAMSLGAVIRTGRTAGPLRLVLRRPLGEGGGLALAVPLCLFEEAGQALDLCF